MDVMQIVEFACLRVIILHYILRPRHRAGSNQVYDNVISKSKTNASCHSCLLQSGRYRVADMLISLNSSAG